MKSARVRAVVCVVLALAALTFVSCTESDVADLTAPGALDKALSSNEPWLLEFFAPWCGHCRRLAPTYEKVATRLKGIVNVGKVDCDANKDIAPRFQVAGFPTLAVVRDGRVYRYSGDRSEENLVNFATNSDWATLPSEAAPAASAAAAVAEPESAGSDSPVITLTAKDFDRRVKAEGGKWLVEFYAPWCGFCKQIAPVYEDVARRLEGEVKVAKIDASEGDDAKVGRRFGVRGFPTIKFVYNGTSVYDYAGDRTADAMAAWASLTDWETTTPNAAYPAQYSLVTEVLEAYVEIGRMFQKYFVQYFWFGIAAVFLLGFVFGACVCYAPAPRRGPMRAVPAVTPAPTAAAPTPAAAPKDTKQE